MQQYVWLIWSLLLLIIWGFFFIFKKNLRREMLWASLWTAPLGLTEPLFVPGYWNPPSLFNLAEKTGFDIESIIFSFAIGGLVAILYEIFFKTRHIKMGMEEHYHRRHRFHSLAVSSPLLIFVALAVWTDWNHIYCAIVAMFLGGIAAIICRPDLKKKVWVGGLLFLGFYFVFFVTLVAVFPDYVRSVWNFSQISGILILGVPLEELLFAFSLGMLWSSLYEHIHWYKLADVHQASG
ncbi:MAG: hypothetical protein GXO71_00740 [Caldiserica bacterium]|nr:hypothetical protein [Caldisericota bacterium]